MGISSSLSIIVEERIDIPSLARYIKNIERAMVPVPYLTQDVSAFLPAMIAEIYRTKLKSEGRPGPLEA
jgi:hypothetical protein